METERIDIHLVPAPDDAALNSPEYQAELAAFDKALRSHGIVPQRVLERLEGAAGTTEPATWLSQFVIVVNVLKPMVVPAIVTAIGGYFHEKRGRRVILEMENGTGKKRQKIKVSAPSPEDAEKALRALLPENRKRKR